MKLKVTPLNFATAFFLFFAGFVFIKGANVTGMGFAHMDTAIGLILLLFAFVVSFLDVIFRNFFADLKKLWLIELSFITLALVIFLIVK
ncbi:hypothetical protein ACFQZS_07955 [Mucilaginibacter calamicampi]|uniref:Uncharacterized protein n=1 Tax=Mucilaginibacter calamicampi TaxID=1302352 RepID=A0ABW2YW37_9SPHI